VAAIRPARTGAAISSSETSTMYDVPARIAWIFRSSRVDAGDAKPGLRQLQCQRQPDVSQADHAAACAATLDPLDQLLHLRIS
jgi:hypothetical protein